MAFFSDAEPADDSLRTRALYQCVVCSTVGTNLSHFHLLANVTLNMIHSLRVGVNPALDYVSHEVMFAFPQLPLSQ